MFQVAAQTGHNVVLVDVSDEVLNLSKSNINKSLARVAKKTFADKPEVKTCVFSPIFGIIFCQCSEALVLILVNCINISVLIAKKVYFLFRLVGLVVCCFGKF